MRYQVNAYFINIAILPGDYHSREISAAEAPRPSRHGFASPSFTLRIRTRAREVDLREATELQSISHFMLIVARRRCFALLRDCR